MTKYKNIETGVTVTIEDVYTNCMGVIPIIQALYDNSREWIKVHPIEEADADKLAKAFAEEHLKGASESQQYRDGVINGVSHYIRSVQKGLK